MNVSYTFVESKNKKYVSYYILDQCRDKWVKCYDTDEPFCLMPFYSEHEKKVRAAQNQATINAELEELWLLESLRREKIKAEYRQKNPTKKYKKKKKGEKTVRQPRVTPAEIAFETKAEWFSLHSRKIKKQVELWSPPLSVSTRKCPSENKIFANVLKDAFEQGIPEEILDLFVHRVRVNGAGPKSEGIAQALFEPFAENPVLLAFFGLVQPPKKGQSLQAIHIPEVLRPLMHEKLYFPRNTGKGELGVLALFGSDIQLASTDKRGDFVWNRGTLDEESVEMKSTETREKSIRLGSTDNWVGTDFQKRVAAIPELKRLSVAFGQEAFQEHFDKIKKHLNMTPKEFLAAVTDELKNCLRQYDRLLVFVEDENVLEEIDVENVFLYCVGDTGRFSFTIVPNNLTKLV